MELTQAIIQELLDYNPETGKLFWKERDLKWFKSDASCKRWHTRFAGKEAFTASLPRGNKMGSILNKPGIPAHRIIWLYVHGEWPEEDIDHINGDPSDNRIENLRTVSRAENLKNQKHCSNNKSGVMGVSWFKPAQKWVAKIGDSSKAENLLGYFNNFDDAVAARKQAEIDRGYHANHGR